MCSLCVDRNTKQKLIDTPSLNIEIQPQRMDVNAEGQLVIDWNEKEQSHQSIFEPEW